MKRIELNHWFVKGNKLSISLLLCHISIEIKNNENGLVYNMLIFLENSQRLEFVFYSLEDAISFAEDLCNREIYNDLTAHYYSTYARKLIKE